MFLRYLLPIFFSLLACSESTKTTLSTMEKASATGFISLHPAITETIFYLGAEENLIGRSDYCTNPTEAINLPAFGTSFTPNLEAIAKARPIGILADQSIAAQNDSLKQLSVVHELPWLNSSDIQQSIIRLGQLLEVDEKASSLALRFQEKLSATPKKDAQTVLMIMMGTDIQKGQLWYIRRDSLHGAALEAAGFRNAAPPIKNTPSMSLEELISINPDIILLMGTDNIDPNIAKESLRILQSLPQLKAAQKKQIARLEMHNVHGIGPGILELPQVIIETVNSL